MENKLLSVTEYARLHDLSDSYVRRLVRNGRIQGATKVGSQWIIPADAALPKDERVTTGKYRNWRKPKDKED